MTPISRIVDSTRVSSDSDPIFPSNSILIKWHPTSSAVSQTDSNHTMIIPGGVFLSWLVNLSTEEINGFVVKGLVPTFLLSIHLSASSVLDQISSLPHMSSIALNPHPRLLADSHCPSQSPITPSQLAKFASMFLECLMSVFISWTQGWSDDSVEYFSSLTYFDHFKQMEASDRIEILKQHKSLSLRLNNTIKIYNGLCNSPC